MSIDCTGRAAKEGAERLGRESRRLALALVATQAAAKMTGVPTDPELLPVGRGRRRGFVARTG